MNFFPRILVAKNDVKAGELIFSDEALVVGPSRTGGAVCVVCLSKVKLKDNCKLFSFCLLLPVLFVCRDVWGLAPIAAFLSVLKNVESNISR